MTFEEFAKLYPSVITGLRSHTQAVKEAGLDSELTEIIKIRASQINGCAFCTKFHLDTARKLGTGQAKLDLIAAWRDAGRLFSTQERAALAWTERLTALPSAHLTEAERQEVLQHFSATEFSQLCIAIATINAWNRIGTGLEFAPPGI